MFLFYHKLITAPIALRTSKLHNCVILCLIKKCISCSSSMQKSNHKIECIDNNVYTAKTEKQIPPIFYNYLKNINPKFREKIIENYLTLNINNTDPYLISREVGKDFVELIKDDLLINMSHVIELNPGFGILTESLLQMGVPFINLYEKSDEFYPMLQDLTNTYPNQLSIKKANLLSISKMLNLNVNSRQDINICELLGNIPEKKWEEDSCMQIIGATTKRLFIRHLIISTVFQTGFMMYGRPIFYLGLSPSVWNKFIYNGKKISTNCIMFNTLFHHKIFGTIDRKGFMPWFRKRKTKNKNENHPWKDDSEVFYVIKLEPKSDLLKLFDGKDNVIYFWHFIRHHFYKPSTRVIPALEKIIPGCGVRLIEKNYNIFTEFAHLNPSQAYELFMEFKSWPEYKQSSFLLSASEINKTYSPYMEENE